MWRLILFVRVCLILNNFRPELEHPPTGSSQAQNTWCMRLSDNICFLVAQYTVLFSVTLRIVRDGCSMKIDHVIIRIIGQGIIVNSDR